MLVYRSTLLLVMSLMLVSVLGAQEPERDPTMPTPELLEKLSPPPESLPSLPAVSRSDGVVNPVATTQLPPIELKSMVLSSTKTGNAIVAIGERRIRIELTPAAYRSVVSVPKAQLNDDAKSDASSVDTDDSLPAPHGKGMMDTSAASAGDILVGSSLIQADSGLMQLVFFDDHMLVFRHLSTGRLTIAH